MVAIKEKVLGPNHTEVGSALHNLAMMLVFEGRMEEAERLYKRAITIKEQALGPEHTETSNALYGLAELYAQQGRNADAEALYNRVLAIKEKQLGKEHTEVATVLAELAFVYVAEARYADAEPIYRRALAIKEKALGGEHPEVSTVLSDLAELSFRQQQWAKAADFWRQSTDIIIRRTRRGTAGLEGQVTSEAKRNSYRFAGFINASFRQAATDKDQASDNAQEAFARAQWAQQSDVARSLEQMAARQAKGGGKLSTLIRERQDLAKDWQAKDKSLVASLAEPTERRDSKNEAALTAGLREIDKRIGEIDKVMSREFPEFASFSHPEPLTIAEVQELLHDNEALIFIVDTDDAYSVPGQSFIWAVTKTEARWVSSTLGTKALSEAVMTLRCGLDEAAWWQPASRCGELTNVMRGEASQPPFDLVRAHELYTALFGQLEDLIKGKQLLIATTGPLATLPFQVLVTEKPATNVPSNSGGYAAAAWLIKKHAISVLPSVISLKSLRKFAKASNAKQPFIGVGNPLLLGPNGDDRRAWRRQSCEKNSAPLSMTDRGRRDLSTQFFEGSLANVAIVRAVSPLPETADELCEVASSMGAAQDAVYLGERANEKTIKTLSAKGTLANARVVHFATHGLLAAESKMVSIRGRAGTDFSPPLNWQQKKTTAY